MVENCIRKKVTHTLMIKITLLKPFWKATGCEIEI